VARRVSKRQMIEALIESQIPGISASFIAAFDQIKSDVQVNALIEVLKRGDIDAALLIVNMSPSAFTSYVRQIESAYIASGDQTMAGVRPVLDPRTGARLIIRFDGRNPAAEEFLKELSGKRIVEIVASQLDAIREDLTAGMMAGNNPRTMALDLVGRYDPRIGKRTGGKIGLTKQQMGWLRNAREELTSGSKDGLSNYLTRALRDRRFDRTVLKAIRDGSPIDPKQVQAMMTRMNDIALKYRADTIARSEAMNAFSVAQENALQDAVSKGFLRPSQVSMVWRTASDSRVRDSHAEMEGQRVKLGESFVSGDGNFLRYPRDPDAIAAEIIQCRCIREDDIDYFEGVL
jgi:hypothetical protein